jgi:dihydropyrimidinase
MLGPQSGKIRNIFMWPLSKIHRVGELIAAVAVVIWLWILLVAAPAAFGEDLLIQGGTVVTVDGARRADVRVRGELVVAVGDLTRESADRRVIDATDLLVLPGGVDPHVHLSATPAEWAFVDDFTTGTRAALAGGITTVGHMAFPAENELPLATLARMQEAIESQALADVFVHTTVVNPSEELIEQLPELVAAGQPSIKVFMPFPEFESHLAGYMQLLGAAHKAGVVVAIHCEDLATVNYVADELTRLGHTTLAHYAESRPIEAEAVATHRAVSMAQTTGATIYIVHLSSGRALAETAGDLDRANVYVETRPLYLHLTDAKYSREDRGLFVGMPPIRGSADQDALWAGLVSGTIDTVATDHAPWTRTQKLDPDQTIAVFRAGVNNLQLMLPMLFSEGVQTGRLTLARFVEVTSTNAAKIFGLYPRKGTIAAGSDADLVLWDPDVVRVIRDADVLSNAGFSVYAGTEVTGWPELTIRRGEIVFENGVISAAPGSGVLAKRTATEN